MHNLSPGLDAVRRRWQIWSLGTEMCSFEYRVFEERELSLRIGIAVLRLDYSRRRLVVRADGVELAASMTGAIRARGRSRALVNVSRF